MKNLKSLFVVSILVCIQISGVFFNPNIANTLTRPDLANNYIISQDKKEISSDKDVINHQIQIQQKSADKKRLKVDMASVIIAAVLWPGLTLLKVAYCLNDIGISFENWLSLFWLLAFVDFILEKIPAFANLFQVLQYPILWLTMTLVLNNLGDYGTTMINNAFIYTVVTVMQILKQTISTAITVGTFGCLGCGGVVMSIIGNIIAVVIVINLCH